MKKMLLIIMLCAITLTGCGKNSENSETNDEPATVNEIHKPITSTDTDKLLEEASTLLGEEYFVDGFLYVGNSYEKYNSYASENGLGDTKIYVEGTVLSTIDLSNEEMLMMDLFVEQEDGNQWCVGVAFANDVGDIVGKEIRVFGTYQGFSDNFNLPTMTVLDNDAKSKIQVKNNNGNYETIWSCEEYVWNYVYVQNGEQNDEPYFVYNGSGDDVITGVFVNDTSYAHIVKKSDSGYFGVKGYYGDDYDLLVNTTSSYDGTTILVANQEYDFEVNATGDWTLEIYKHGYTDQKSFSGCSDFVTPIFYKSDNVYEVTSTGSGYFVVKGYSAEGRELLINTTADDYSGKVMFSTDNGWAFFVVQTEREWSIKPVE